MIFLSSLNDSSSGSGCIVTGSTSTTTSYTSGSKSSTESVSKMPCKSLALSFPKSVVSTSSYSITGLLSSLLVVYVSVFTVAGVSSNNSLVSLCCALIRPPKSPLGFLSLNFKARRYCSFLHFSVVIWNILYA